MTTRAIQCLRHVLKTGRDVDGVAKRGEHRVVAKADVADDDLAAVDADAELDRLLQFAGELVIHVFDVGGNHRGGPHRLPAGGRRIDIEAEQCKQAVADELVRLPAGVDHRLRCGLQETIDQEHDIERQTRLGHPGRPAHVDEHADDIALFTDVDAAPVADKVGADIGRQHGNDGDIVLRPKLAREPDRF